MPLEHLLALGPERALIANELALITLLARVVGEMHLVHVRLQGERGRRRELAPGHTAPGLDPVHVAEVVPLQPRPALQPDAAQVALVVLDVQVNRINVVLEAVLHRRGEVAAVAGERPDLEVDGVVVGLQVPGIAALVRAETAFRAHRSRAIHLA